MMSLRTFAIGWCALYVFLAVPGTSEAQFGATPFSDPATGERYHVEAAGALWNPPPNLEVASEALGIVGTRINAVSDLGIKQKRIGELRFVLRPSQKHKFRINYLPMTYKENVSSIHREFVFNGLKYGVNLPVTTDFSWKTWLLGYEYDFLYRDNWFVGFVLQAKLTDVQVYLRAPIGTDFVRAQAPIPNVGGIARYYIVPNISVTGEMVGFKLPDSVSEDYRAHYFDFDLYGTVNFNDFVGAQLGFRRIDVGYLIDKDQGDFEMKGIYFGGVVRY
jgi:hypothetical protein